MTGQMPLGTRFKGTVALRFGMVKSWKYICNLTPARSFGVAPFDHFLQVLGKCVRQLPTDALFANVRMVWVIAMKMEAAKDSIPLGRPGKTVMSLL